MQSNWWGISNFQIIPTYQYRYILGDNPSYGYGKIESRQGEYANGRYYVNSKHSAVDVKYIADEWGYHPIVKYGSLNQYTSPNTRYISNADENIRHFPKNVRNKILTS